MQREIISISNSYALKWRFKEYHHLKVSECRKIINVKTGKLKKICYNAGSKGVWIGKKFITLDKLNQHIELIPDFGGCPF